MQVLRKILLTLLVTIISIGGFAQSVNSPSATSYFQNTANQSVSGFSLSNFNTSATLLVTVGLVNPPAGVTLTLSSSSGLALSTGYSSWSNFTRISFTGTQANINAALSNLKVNTGSTPGNVYIAVTATENPTGYYYLPSNGHFYRPMSWPAGASYSGTSPSIYTNILSLATSQTFKGQTGYLVTITSQDEQNFVQANVPGSNILIALSDVQQEGVWQWDAGPEAGTIIKTSNSGGNIAGQYNNWCGGEPNNWGAGEHNTVTKWGGGNCWNDFGPPSSSLPGSVSGYVVEFGTWSDPANQTFTDFYTGFVTHQIACSASQTPNAPTGVNGSRNGTGTVSISATVPTGVTVDWYTNSTGGNPFLVNSTIYTTPTISTTTSYYAQARNTTTGCISSTRTEVKAVIVLPTPFSYTCIILDWDSLPISGVNGTLYIKTKGSTTYSLYQTYSTDSNGKFAISTTLDTTSYDFQIVIGDAPVQQPTISDAEFFNQKILSDSIEARDYYRMNTNGNSYLTISDVYLIYQRTHGADWPAGVLPYRLFTQAERATISSSTTNLLALYPGQETITLTNPTAAETSSFYLITTGVER
jgi:hypothetical protein